MSTRAASGSFPAMLIPNRISGYGIFAELRCGGALPARASYFGRRPVLRISRGAVAGPGSPMCLPLRSAGWICAGAAPDAPWRTPVHENVRSIGRASCGRLQQSTQAHLLEAGAHIRIIQTLLGHRNLNTTATNVSITTVCAARSPLESLPDLPEPPQLS